MKKKQHKDEYLRGKVPQQNTTERLRTEKVSQPKKKYWYQTEKMEKKQHKDEYMTGKVPQAKTTQRLLTEKMKKNQHKD